MFNKKMLIVKIEFFPLIDIQATFFFSRRTIVLHNRMFMCKLFPSNRRKVTKRKRNFTLSTLSLQAFQRNSFYHANAINL